MKMNLITNFLHYTMRKEDIGLVLLTTRVISSLGRSLLMKLNRLLPDLLLEVLPKTSPNLRLNPPEGRINH